VAKGISLGSAIVSLIDPHPGHEREFNEWYERDHVYACAMAGPHTFALSRWVATRDLKALRRPDVSSIADPVTAGSFLTLFWIEWGRDEEQAAWVSEMLPELQESGRMLPHRDHVCTATYEFRGAVLRDTVTPELACDHRYDGLVAVWLEREPSVALADVEARVLRLVEPVIDSSPLGQALLFTPRPRPAAWPADVADPAGVGDRLLLLAFLDCDPREWWTPWFAGLDAVIDGTGLANTSLVAPFVPTVPGTDRYLDEL
jgi:hypothetical protein